MFVLWDPATRALTFVIPMPESVLMISEPPTLHLSPLLEEADGQEP